MIVLGSRFWIGYPYFWKNQMIRIRKEVDKRSLQKKKNLMTRTDLEVYSVMKKLSKVRATVWPENM